VVPDAGLHVSDVTPTTSDAVGIEQVAIAPLALVASTEGLAVGTWQLRVDLGDGVPHVVLVSLK
jgi:hypothetical protein